MRRKRLCFVTTVPMAVTAFFRLHIERLSQDYDVFVVSNYEDQDLPVDSRVTYLHLPIARNISLWRDLSTVYALLKQIRQYRFDLLQSVTPKAGLLGMLAARLAGLPVRVHWFTGQVWVTRTGIGRWILKSADKVIAALATHVLADSPSQRDFLVAEKVCRDGEVTVIGDGSICGVDGERFRPNAEARAKVREAHGIPSEAPVVLFLGRLNTDKGLRELAQAILILEAKFTSAHWLVVGPDEGGMVEYIRSVLGGGDLDGRLHFQGFTAEPESYMAAADVFCLPSYREGFGSSVLEAAAAGVPSVATRIYGLTDAVEDRVSGVLVAPKCVDALVHGLAELLADTELREQMGRDARERAIRQFSRERIVEGLRDYYQHLLADR